MLEDGSTGWGPALGPPQAGQSPLGKAHCIQTNSVPKLNSTPTSLRSLHGLGPGVASGRFSRPGDGQGSVPVWAPGEAAARAVERRVANFPRSFSPPPRHRGASPRRACLFPARRRQPQHVMRRNKNKHFPFPDRHGEQGAPCAILEPQPPAPSTVPTDARRVALTPRRPEPTSRIW